MATIDNLDLSVYNLYAIRTRMIEQINQQFRLDQADSIPPQTQVLNIYPKLTELDILLGIVPLHTPWAYFFPPQRFRFLRRSPFSRNRIAPSFGSMDHSELEKIIEEIACQTPEEQEEKEAIAGCVSQMDRINSWLGFILGRIGQFLQG